jgi:4-diphosphocytidyl-2-C-methyl-D-erythritol kinase
MERFTLRIEGNAYGKINLALDVLYKRDDGYHEISSIMQQVSLHDTVIIEEGGRGVEIECDNHLVPLDHTNLVHKAWNEISRLTGTKTGIRVKIHKRIPVAAGLAGGSSNGAAVLKGLNTMWDLGLSQEILMDIGGRIGADIPFCIMGGTALAEGIGERLTRLRSLKDKHILLANPGIGISSAYAYSRLTIPKDHKGMDSMVQCIEKDDLKCLSKEMFNIFEGAIIPENPIIGDIKNTMEENGALRALMSGSGASVFGLYDDLDKLEFAKRKLQKDIPYVFHVTTV